MPMPTTVMEAIAAILGDDIDGTTFGRHGHECQDCHTVWYHDGRDTQELSSEDYRNAHCCRRCGREERMIIR